MSSLLQLLSVCGLALTSGLIMAPACPAIRTCSAAAPIACRPMMQAPDQSTETSAPTDDFTEDLLDALAADEVPFSDADQTPAVFVKAENPTEVLEPRVAYTNEQLVEDMKAKYKTHENDCGSAQVQIAVLSARIQYMTAHMQQNKKDYASLRGLTRMVTRRRKLLEYLLKNDIELFKRLTSELGIRTTQLLKPKLGGARGRRV